MSSPETAPDPAADPLIGLMCRYQQADPAAADELVTRIHPILTRFLYALNGDSRHVDDLLQDCWLRIHRARHSYRPGDPVLPWILAIARHARVDHYRRWQRTAGRESAIDAIDLHPHSDPRRGIESRLQANSVLAAMQSLPDAQREVLLMLKLGGMSIQEVASATGSSASAVKQKAFRAYQSVRAALGLRAGKGDAPDDLR
jgi:RNA polymerase sigma-70 factor (ECF subfamily)